MLLVYSDWNLLGFLQEFLSGIFTNIWAKIFHKHSTHGNRKQICIVIVIQNTLEEYLLKYDEYILKGAMVCACKTFKLSNSRVQRQKLCFVATMKTPVDSLSCCHLQDTLAVSYKILAHLSILWTISHTVLVLRYFKKTFHEMTNCCSKCNMCIITLNSVSFYPCIGTFFYSNDYKAIRLSTTNKVFPSKTEKGI